MSWEEVIQGVVIFREHIIVGPGFMQLEDLVDFTEVLQKKKKKRWYEMSVGFR